MNTPHTVFAGSIAYTVVDDVSLVHRALITGAVLDEITGEAPSGDLDVRAAEPGVQTRSTGLGLYGVAAYPSRSVPHLDTTSYTFHLSFAATGYRAADLSVQIPQNSPLPVTAPEVLLRRLPVSIGGRVVGEVNGAPVAGATVQVITPQTVALHQPARFNHAAGVPVRVRALTPDAVPRTLAVGTAAGDSRVVLDNQSGLSPGDVLLFDPSREVEYVVVESLAAVGVNLSAPLKHSFPSGTAAPRVTLGGVTDSSSLAQAAEAGEAVLLLASTVAGAALEIDDPPRREFHALGARTSAQGYYSIAGIARLKTAQLKASAPGFTGTPTVILTIDYDRPVNPVDFRL